MWIFLVQICRFLFFLCITIFSKITFDLNFNSWFTQLVFFFNIDIAIFGLYPLLERLFMIIFWWIYLYVLFRDLLKYLEISFLVYTFVFYFINLIIGALELATGVQVFLLGFLIPDTSIFGMALYINDQSTFNLCFFFLSLIFDKAWKKEIQ